MALQQIQLTNSAILSQLSLQAGYFTKHPPTNGTNQMDSYVLEKADDQKLELNKGVNPHLIPIFDHRPSRVRT